MQEEKQTEIEETVNQTVVRCPICFREVWHRYDITDHNNDRALWHHCFCGCFFHAEPILKPHLVFNEEYRARYEDLCRIKTRMNYTSRTYLPMIEEITWGRKCLDVGYCVPYFMDALKERGWITWGIDLLTPTDKSDKTLQGDFLTYDFGIKRFDLVIMGDVLQCFINPISAIKKAYKLLNPGGVLLVWSPDASQLWLVGSQAWAHWNRKEHRVYFDGTKFKEIAQKMGFDLVYFWRNVNPRFSSIYTFHCILQKPYIRLDTEAIADVMEDKKSEQINKS